MRTLQEKRDAIRALNPAVNVDAWPEAEVEKMYATIADRADVVTTTRIDSAPTTLDGALVALRDAQIKIDALEKVRIDVLESRAKTAGVVAVGLGEVLAKWRPFVVDAMVAAGADRDELDALDLAGFIVRVEAHKDAARAADEREDFRRRMGWR